MQRFDRNLGLSSEIWSFSLATCMLLDTVTQDRSSEAHLPKEFLGYFKLQCNASQLLGTLNFTLQIQ